jgi:multisubunit Na+/H+ antiporter MnhF subunit
MILKILIGSAAIFALYRTIKSKKIFPSIISLGMIFAVAMVLFPVMAIQTAGIYVYCGFVALAFIYGLLAKDKKLPERIIIFLMSASIFVYWLWVLNHWHGNEVLAPILTVIVSIAGIIRNSKMKDEWGFLTILAVDAIAILIEVWIKVH